MLTSKCYGVIEMNGTEVITFFLNLYHVILLHAHVEMGAPSAGSPRFSYLETMAYRVGRATLSLFYIEYDILRARISKPVVIGMRSRMLPIPCLEIGLVLTGLASVS